MKKMTLSQNQINYVSRYLAASNVGTMWDGKELPKTDVKKYVEAYWGMARRNHDEAGIDLTPEVRSFERDLKKGGKDCVYWVEAFEKEFGTGSVAALDQI